MFLKFLLMECELLEYGYVYSEQLSSSKFQDQNVDCLKMLIIINIISFLK